MKVKGINWFEKNVEKLVLGLAALMLLAAAMSQVVLRPNHVKIGREATLRPPQEAWDPVEREAEALNKRLEDPSPTLPQHQPIELGAGFSDGIKKSVAPARPTAIALGHRTPYTGGTGTAVKADAIYATFTVPAPTDPIAVGFRNTIDPREHARNRELQPLLPEAQPFDKAAVTIGAVFNGAAVRELLSQDPDGDGPIQPIPTPWFKDASDNDLLTILAVQVEREVVTPAEGSKASPGDKTMFHGMPGRPDPFTEWYVSKDGMTRIKSNADAQQAIDVFQTSADEIVRPRYYPTIAGPVWSEPSELAIRLDSGEDESKVTTANLKAQLALLDKKLQDINNLIAAATGSAPPPPTGRRGEGASPSGGGKSGAGPTQSPGGRDARPSDPATGGRGNRAALAQNKKSLETQRERVLKKLADAGEKVDAVPGTTTPDAPTKPATLLSNSAVSIWAHDLRAEPGATYRYRVRVVMNNPMFDRNLQASQKSLGEKPYIEGEWSDWTDDVQVEPAEYFFITSATPRSDLTALPHAVAELLVYYYGYWRKATVSLEPGDPLIGTAKLPDGLVIFEVPKVALAPDAPSPPPVPTPSRPRDDNQETGGRGGRLAAPSPGREPGASPAQPAGPVAAIEGMTSKPAKKEIDLKVDAFFLDVAKVAASLGNNLVQRDLYEAVLRNKAGNVVFRSPDADRSSPLFKRLDASVKAGLAAAKIEPPPPEKQPDPTAPIPPPPPPPKKTSPPGGGGGGGGG